jgi:hypothetical protein
VTQAEQKERAFSFVKVNQRQTKPRSRGVTEIRGPYYTPQRQTNLKSGKSKTPNPNGGLGIFHNFGHLKLFRISDFALRIFVLGAFAGVRVF